MLPRTPVTISRSGQWTHVLTEGTPPAGLLAHSFDNDVPRTRPPGTSLSTARSATWLRHEFSAWLALDVTSELLDDLVTAVYEAAANVAEHAYADHPAGPGPVRLGAHRYYDAVQITIADDGIWRAVTGEPLRSRGLPLMRELMHEVHVDRGPGGTVVHLRTEIAPPTPPG